MPFPCLRRGSRSLQPNVVFVFLVLSCLSITSAFGPPYSIHYYELPTLVAGPCVVTVGPDGKTAWAQEGLADKIARIDPVSGKVTEYPIPWSLEPLLPVELDLNLPIGGITPVGCAIESGKDGKIYAANGLRNQIVSLDPETGNIEVYSAPNVLGNLQPLNDITPGKDSIWFTQTTGNQIGRFSYHDHSFTNYDIPTPLSIPIGIFAASDGGIWFTEAAGQKIGRITPKTGKIVEYQLPLSLAGPFVIRAETENRYLWFTAVVGNAIGRIEMATGKTKAFPIPQLASLPIAICASDVGDLWFTHLTMNELTQLTPSTGTFNSTGLPETILSTLLPIGLPPTLPAELSCKPGNAVWFVEGLRQRVGRLQLP